ncbi:Pr6Pr family membrane protein [Microbacterium candidum]|uniref:Pr6Pr family membrane protein n=1 Tax=Microbacterium candidum TaxID=3041922 RepID=A0ABT7MUH8_9MICO|nr:Pr6Pr family membrane protein [Microbacterium sp. ASV49]MDL9978094.1 Pr6Pr family membrane protein [Microbacterium sp. ASV49]
MTRTPAWAQTWTVLRALVAVLIAAAIVAQAVRTIGGAMDAGRDVGTTVTNFFSFFTILSNVGAVIVLLWAAVWFWTRGRNAASEPRGLGLMLASVTTYMIVTGIVYNTLLRGVELPQGTTVPWSNEVLHVVGPAFLLLDLFLAPRRRCLGWGAIGVVLIFPLVWVAYTLLRGENVVNPVNGDHWWYPYPFLNPHLGSWASVWFWVGVIAVALGVAAAGVVWVSRIRGRVRQPEPALAT